MTDVEIIEALQRVAVSGRATAVADLLARLAPEGLTQGTLVTYFKRAFPEVPLRTLLEAGAWHRVSGGCLSDDEFNALLASWIPTSYKPES